MLKTADRCRLSPHRGENSEPGTVSALPRPQSQLVAGAPGLWFRCAFYSDKPPRSLSSGLVLHPYASNRTGSVCLHIIAIAVHPRVPSVRLLQSHMKVRDQMPFLHLHPGPRSPHGSWRPAAPLPLCRTGEKPSALPQGRWLSLGHQGTWG